MDPSKQRPDSHINDHLANERTYLAWMRTSLGIMAFGFVIERFSIFTTKIAYTFEKLHIEHKPTSSIYLPERTSKFGALLIIIGILLGFMSYMKYKRIQKQIENEMLYSSRTLLETALLGLTLIIGLCLLLFLYLPTDQ